MWRVLGGLWVTTASGVAWLAATHCRRRCSMPRLLAFSGEVAEAVAAQTMTWQPSSRYSVRVGIAYETSSLKLHEDLLGL